MYECVFRRERDLTTTVDIYKNLILEKDREIDRLSAELNRIHNRDRQLGRNTPLSSADDIRLESNEHVPICGKDGCVIF